jgi:hypothetical protein
VLLAGCLLLLLLLLLLRLLLLPRIGEPRAAHQAGR